MATITRPRNRDRVLRQILGNILYEKEADAKAGHAGQIGYLKSKIWVCDGVASGAAPSGMNAYDLILDTTTDDVYRYITGTTYVKMTATS